jgi:hypothetical protein
MAGSAVPALLGAAVVRARRQIANYFLEMHAISAEEAVAYVPESGIQRSQFSWMQRARLVHEAQPGTYWLDAPAYWAMQEARRRRVTLVLGIVLIIFACVMLLGYRLRG